MRKTVYYLCKVKNGVIGDPIDLSKYQDKLSNSYDLNYLNKKQIDEIRLELTSKLSGDDLDLIRFSVIYKSSVRIDDDIRNLTNNEVIISKYNSLSSSNKKKLYSILSILKNNRERWKWNVDSIMLEVLGLCYILQGKYHPTVRFTTEENNNLYLGTGYIGIDNITLRSDVVDIRLTCSIISEYIDSKCLLNILRDKVSKRCYSDNLIDEYIKCLCKKYKNLMKFKDSKTTLGITYAEVPDMLLVVIDRYLLVKLLILETDGIHEGSSRQFMVREFDSYEHLVNYLNKFKIKL